MAHRGELVPLFQDRVGAGFQDQAKAGGGYSQTPQFELQAKEQDYEPYEVGDEEANVDGQEGEADTGGEGSEDERDGCLEKRVRASEPG